MLLIIELSTTSTTEPILASALCVASFRQGTGRVDSSPAANGHRPNDTQGEDDEEDRAFLRL